MTNRRLLVIGSAPGRDHVGEEAFVHTPSGRRLAKFIGLSVDHLPDVCDLDNVLRYFPGKGSFPMNVALQEAVHRLGEWPDSEVVLPCGPRVAQTLGCAHPGYLWWHRCHLRDDTTRWLARYPHPSGENRWWNDPHRYHEAAVFLWESVWSGAPLEAIGPAMTPVEPGRGA